MSYSLQPMASCPSLSPGVCSNSCPLSQWWVWSNPQFHGHFQPRARTGKIRLHATGSVCFFFSHHPILVSFLLCCKPSQTWWLKSTIVYLLTLLFLTVWSPLHMCCQLAIICRLTCLSVGIPGGSESKASACNSGDLGLNPRLERFPWRRAWWPTPVFLPGESTCTEEPGGLQSMNGKADTTEQLSTANSIWSGQWMLPSLFTGLWH